MRRFDDIMGAWHYVCAQNKLRGRYKEDPVATIQSLPPPPGFFLPPPMTFNSKGDLVPIDIRANHPLPNPTLPLSLATGDNGRLDQRPVSTLPNNSSCRANRHDLPAGRVFG
jgi:hypothetical protein